MSELNAGRLWSRYAAFVEANLERSRDAVNGLRTGNYTPAQYLKDWMTFRDEAMEVAMVPYDLVFRDIDVPTIDRLTSIAGPASLDYAVPLPVEGAVDNDLLKCQSGGVTKTLAFVTKATSDNRCILITVPSIVGALAAETYKGTVHAQGDPTKVVAYLVLAFTE